MMMLASGVNYGFRASLPHLLGISLGFGFMLLALGLGLSVVFTQFPFIHTALKIAGTIYMIWLAYKIATSLSALEGKGGKPMSFLQACAFQWVNPKAWMMALGALATYPIASEPYIAQVAVVALVFVLFNGPCVSVWLGLGVSLKAWLSDPVRQTWFNRGMALLLVLSLYPIAIELLHYLRGLG